MKKLNYSIKFYIKIIINFTELKCQKSINESSKILLAANGSPCKILGLLIVEQSFCRNSNIKPLLKKKNTKKECMSNIVKIVEAVRKKRVKKPHCHPQVIIKWFFF